jgi:hypothetical protein
MLPPRLAGGPPGDRARLQALARAPGVTGRSGPYPVAAAVLRARGYTVGVMPEGPDRYPAARCRCARPGRPRAGGRAGGRGRHGAAGGAGQAEPAVLIAAAAGAGDCDGRGCLEVRPALAQPEEPGQGDRELPADVVVAGRGGLPDGRDKVLVLGVAPGQRLVVGGERQRLTVRRRDTERDAPLGGFQAPAGGLGRVQVSGEHPLQRCGASGISLVRLGRLGGVDAQQVVEPVAAGRVLGMV